jgi:acyl carrier protein
VDRKALPAPEAMENAQERIYVAPRSTVEETLAAIWSEVLRVERVGVLDDFFLLGGHSLSAARVLSRVRDALGVELPLAAVFETPTLAGMAEAVSAAPRPAAAPPPEAEVAEQALLARAAELSDADLDALLMQMMTEGQA